MSMIEFIEQDRDEWRLATMKLRERNRRLETALKAARLVLVERGLAEDSRIVGVIDTALS